MAIAIASPALLEPVVASAQVQAPGVRSESGRVRTLPLTKFYDTPDPVPAGKPGDLIRSQPFDEYELPLSVSAVRILYHSRSAAGEDVAVSGVVLFPYDKQPPRGGWPVIAWAHAATGVARQCAPSLMRNIGHGPFLSMYVNLGYAVVATDYAGLGTHFRNAFLDGPSNATDVINSVPAARAAVPQLGARWIVVGETEGALAAMVVADKESEIRDPNYLGAIAISLLANARETYEHPVNGSASATLPSLAYGIKTVYPQFRITDVLTDKALALYKQLEQTCSPTRTTPDWSAAEIVNPAWEANPFVHRYFDRNELGTTRAYGPIFVITGDADPAIPPTIRAQAFARICKQGDRVQWERYPNLDAGRVMGDSVRDQIGWIEARFAGRAAPTNCP
ncbi:MAG: lipase family protein [Candidatus Sulfotelmatobacter sp.]